MKKILLSASFALATLAAASAQASEAVHFESRAWSWNGLFGTYDKASLQRGYQVYKEVCSACHSMKLVAYRNLQEIGLSEEQVKEIAASYQVTDGPNDEGEMFQRPAKLSDRFVSPFANEKAARFSNNGALPPDLSLIAKARIQGPDYLYALLTGYVEPPAGKEKDIAPGMTWNAAFPGNQIAMPAIVNDDTVAYADGTKATKEQIAHDVVSFLNWAAEPELPARKSMGLKALIFLGVLTAMLYALKRKIFAKIH